MLEKVALNQKMGKKEYKEAMEQLEPRLSRLQRACRSAQIPVVIVFEGLDAAGKGTLISQLIGAAGPQRLSGVHHTERNRRRKIPSLSLALLDKAS